MLNERIEDLRLQGTLVLTRTGVPLSPPSVCHMGSWSADTSSIVFERLVTQFPTVRRQEERGYPDGFNRPSRPKFHEVTQLRS